MNIIQWYAVALAAPTALSISFYVLGISIGILRTYATHHFLKHVFYARVHKYIRGTTRYHALLIAALLGGNALCLTIRTHGRAEILRRAGLLSTLNLVPLALGSHMNSIVNCCGLGYDAYGAIHRWIGRVAVIEGVIHVILAVNLERPSLHSSIQVAAVVAASAMATILITSFSIVRHHFYEVFLNLHRVLVVVLIVAIWLHVPGKLLNIPTIYLLVVCCLWASLQLLRTCQILYRNFRHWKYSCKVAIAPLPDAYQVHAKIPRSWKYRAGQYVYLCLPGVSYSAILQSHPYMIAWWYRYDTAQDIVVFIIQRRMGFTHSLPTDSRAVRAIIEGPFGNEIHLDDYGTVLLFATGIGIAGQLLYVRQLLENFHNHDAKARRVALFWQVDSEEHLTWVGQWMTDLLEQDSKYILDIRLFVTGNYTTKGAEHGMVGRVGTHDRIVVNYRGLDIENLIRSEIEERKGRSVISLCVNDHVGEQVREVMRQMLDKDIHLKELPFHPL